MKSNLSLSGQWLCVTLLSLACLQNARAADPAIYAVGRSQLYTQSSDTQAVPASTGAFGFEAFAVPTAPDSLPLATLTPPGSMIPQFLNPTDAGFELASSYATESALSQAFPVGDYTFTLYGSDFSTTQGKLTLATGTFPVTPLISNYTAAQALDPQKDFVLNWNAFTDAAAGDFVQLTVVDDSETAVFQTGVPGQSTVLAGASRSVTIPADTLESEGSYFGKLSFAKVVGRNATGGMVLLIAQTRFSIKPAGSSGGGGGGIPTGIPPLLLTTSPLNGAVNVAVNLPIKFTFTKPMAPAQVINWSANVSAAKFTYTWSADGQALTATYSGNLPENATITWALDPTAFKDTAGTALLAFNNTGSFKTGSGQSNPNDPCSGGSTDNGLGVFSLNKSIRYLQSSAAAPVIESDNGAVFGVYLKSPATNPVTQASLQLPNGTTRPLTNFFGQFLLSDEFATEAALEAAYPAGNYTLQLTRSSGSVSLVLALPAVVPPTPQIANYPQTQEFNPTNDFTLQWLPFTGAALNDGLSLDLNAPGANFHAPDLCIPRPLANTATSIVVPRNTFGVVPSVDGLLTFAKYGTVDTNSLPGITAVTAFSKSTSFKLQSASSTPSGPPELINFTRQQGGTVHFQVKANAGATVLVEASTDLKAWTPVPTGAAVSGLVEVVDIEAATLGQRFYRARTL